jgi:hypothetical protein
MSYTSGVKAFGFALMLSLVASSACLAQLAPSPKNPNISIEYRMATAEVLRPIQQKLQQMRVLEMLQEFLAPLRLPHNLSIRLQQCGALRQPYQPGGPVVICYEYVREIERNAPQRSSVYIGPYRLGRELVIAGGFVQLALNETAHAVFDLLKIPVWGNRDDAADYVVGVVMLQFGKDVAVITLTGTAWFLAQRGFWGAGDFTDVVRSSDAQRFYNYLCIAYGAEPEAFRFMAENANLPRRRAERCASSYRKLLRSFKQTIMPHVDQELLVKVREVDWGARMGLQKSKR